MDFSSCLDKQESIKKILLSCPTPEKKYLKIIEMGKALAPLPASACTEENRVQGCQSVLYLLTSFEDGKIYFTARAEALISAGLAALLLTIYSGEPPEALFRCPPRFIEELILSVSLSPGRSNGLASLFLRMQQSALPFLKNNC